MKIKGLNDYNIVDYKLPSMYVAFPYCSFKCGRNLCQNQMLEHEPCIDIDIDILVNQYITNPLTKAIVCGGLEPFDSPELYDFIAAVREKTNDDIVIYSGYEEHEIRDKVKQIIQFSNITIKFGRYIPQEKSYFNHELGVVLAGENQYAVRYRNESEAKSRYKISQ